MTAALLFALAALLGAAAFVVSLRTPLPSGRVAGGVALMAVAVGLAAARQFALALPVGFVALGLLRGALAAARATPQPGGASEVRTEALAMTLDHDSGEMDGEVLAGRFRGRWLSELSAEELQALAQELDTDADSLALLLAFLDRRRGPKPAAEAQPVSDPQGMSAAEALRILGLEAGATPEEVRAAHRRLMKRVHPDLGGSDALAAMINAAKSRLDP